MEEKEVQLKRKRGKSDMWAGNVKIFSAQINPQAL